MKNISRTIMLAVSLLFVSNISVVEANDSAEPSLAKFNQKELVSLSGPSVVRIVQKVTGEIVVKPFTLDLDKMTIFAGSGEIRKITVDDYATGSGFIVSEDGYILTNSHVISEKEIKQQYITDVATSAIMDASLWYMGSSTDLNDAVKMEAYAEKINEYLLRESTFSLQQSTVVLDPSSKGEKIEDLIGEGFPISVVSVNDNYGKDFWDIALIKIDQKNLPALPLGESTSIKRGETIGVFGFPTTAELNNKNLLESTFTQGVVSAIKDSENKDFNIVQTDAKISSGSSGGPLLNERGEVIGMITYQTNEMDSVGGDNFAFALPIDVVREGIKKFNTTGAEIIFEPGDYNAQFSKGLIALHNAKCKSAMLFFENAKNTNDKFNASANVQSYQKKCQELISSGQSIDTKWDKAKQTLFSLDDWMWGVVALLLLTIIAISFKLFTVKRRLRKDEKEIVFLEEELKHNSDRDALEQAELVEIEKELDELRKSKK